MLHAFIREGGVLKSSNLKDKSAGSLGCLSRKPVPRCPLWLGWLQSTGLLSPLRLPFISPLSVLSGSPLPSGRGTVRGCRRLVDGGVLVGSLPSLRFSPFRDREQHLLHPWALPHLHPVLTTFSEGKTGCKRRNSPTFPQATLSNEPPSMSSLLSKQARREVTAVKIPINTSEA